jgi:hypothetical protein
MSNAMEWTEDMGPADFNKKKNSRDQRTWEIYAKMGR